ncbi:MAG TPA: phosphonatase-like hydrolase [Pyrinomonadaceae bacterium]|nr:phosphonatase-like hydrolase [Pyrinomonadaceae bacterium]
MDDVELVVFDMAGTTVRDAGQVTDAFTAALSEHGIEVTPAQLLKVRGSSKREAVRGFIPEEDLAKTVYNSFREHLARLYRTKGVEPIEGAEESFRRLRQRGVRVALNTGFDRDITGLLLSALKWDEGVVDAIVCGDDVLRGRPAPDLILRAMAETGAAGARRVVNVGDTVLDLQAGHNAGVRWNVGVLTGAHERKLLEQAPHTHLLESVAALPSLLAVIVGERLPGPVSRLGRRAAGSSSESRRS